MASIRLSNVSVDFPVFNAVTRSLKNRLLSAATGGMIDRRWDGHVIVRGLQDVTLALEEGERLGLVGHNGAGKTTLLRVLSGIYYPTQGTSEIEGECVSLINMSLGIDPEATGRENIKLRGAIMGIPAEELCERIDEIAEFSGLGEFLDMPAGVRSVWPQAPALREIKHLAQHGEHPVRLIRCRPISVMQLSDLSPGHVGDLPLA